VGRHLDHRSAVAAILDAGWNLGPRFDPNADFEAPAPTGDPSAPAAFLHWEIQYDQVERATFGGTVRSDGMVVLGCWVERGGSDAVARAMADQLVTLFADQESAGLQFHQPIEGEPVYEGDDDNPTWYAIPVVVPFTEFREA